MKYVVGWDGGGTKTAVQIRNTEGDIVFQENYGPLNYNSVSKEAMRTTTEEILIDMEAFAKDLSNYQSICIATAGVSNKEGVSFIKNTVKSMGLVQTIHVIGDHEAALAGALGEEEGIVLISGTGSICYGQDKKGNVYRSGGYGHLIDDEGSGYAIGRDLLAAAVRIHDHRLSESKIKEEVFKRIHGKSVDDIVNYVYDKDTRKKEIAGLADILLLLLSNGDSEAINICKKASKELAALVIALAKQMQTKKAVLVLQGGILTNYKPIRDGVLDILCQEIPDLVLQEPIADSVSGAAFIAFKNYMHAIKTEG
jgi:N-acetylglucosamine kinase-like BadF-type ATPase